MSQPIITYSLNWGNNSAQRLSGQTYVNPSGVTVDCSQVSVTFSSSQHIKKFYATAVKEGQPYGFIDDVLVDIGDSLDGEAYAVFDSSNNTLTFFRDEENKYTNGQIIGTKTYYTGVENSGTTQIWSSQANSVYGVVFEDKIKPNSCARWFSGMRNMTSITGLDKLDTSNVTDMNYMFYNCSGITSLNISHFKTSNVTTMHSMFRSCSSLVTIDTSHFDTSKVTNMNYMFSNCSKITTTLNIMRMPTNYLSMCSDTAKNSGQLILKYISPVTSANIDTLVATKNNGNVINGGEGSLSLIITSSSSGTTGTGIKIVEYSDAAANTNFTFSIRNTHLTSGEGSYRIGLYVQNDDGTWNYEYFFVPSGSDYFELSDSTQQNPSLLQVPVKTN